MPRSPRPAPQSPRYELIALRERKFGHLMTNAEFAQRFLGITRLHMADIESGRRRPSTELVLRWLVALAPEARIEMFGDVPLVEKKLRLLQNIQKITANAAFAA